MTIVHLLQARAQLLSQLRQFFAERHVLEVTTSVLSQSAVTDPTIESFATIVADSHSGDAGESAFSSPPRYMRTSPEFAIKRLLSAGCGDVYEIGPVFRRGEQGRLHNPEFTLLEWYRLNYSMQDLISEVVALLRCVSVKSIESPATQEQSFKSQPKQQPPLADVPMTQMTYAEAFANYLELDFSTLTSDKLQQYVDQLEEVPDASLDRDQWLDYLFSMHIQPHFRGITVVTHYPASQAALAQLDARDSTVALRFEVFVGSVELANGFEELTDGKVQRQRFEKDNQLRQARQQQQMPIDGRFINALEKGLPACSGVALGIERLLMILCDKDDIQKLLAWPWDQA